MQALGKVGQVTRSVLVLPWPTSWHFLELAFIGQNRPLISLVVSKWTINLVNSVACISLIIAVVALVVDDFMVGVPLSVTGIPVVVVVLVVTAGVDNIKVILFLLGGHPNSRLPKGVILKLLQIHLVIVELVLLVSLVPAVFLMRRATILRLSR